MFPFLSTNYRIWLPFRTQPMATLPHNTTPQLWYCDNWKSQISKHWFFWFHLIPSWTLWRVWWRWEVLSGLTVQLRSQAERIQRVRRGQWCGQGERGGQWQHWQQSDSVIHWHWAHRDNYSGDTGDSVHILNDCLVTWYLPSMGGESWAWSWSRVDTTHFILKE